MRSTDSTMRKAISSLILIISVGSGFGQTIDLSVYDSETARPLEETGILVSTSDLQHQVEFETDSLGKASFILPSVFQRDSIFNIRVAKEDYATKFLTATFKNSNTLKLEIWLEEPTTGHGTKPMLEYSPGALEPMDKSWKDLAEMIHILKNNPDLNWVMTFGYSPNEVDGYEVSIKRANHLINCLMGFDLKGDELIIKIVESELYSQMFLQIAEESDE